MKTKTLAALAAAVLMTVSYTAKSENYQLSSHILDIGSGKPAEGVTITLSKLSENSEWKAVDSRKTDVNGRVKDFLEENGTDNRGIYKLTYDTKPYFESKGQETFYPFVEVVFEISDDSHYHVPITLSPFGYSTYRGN